MLFQSFILLMPVLAHAATLGPRQLGAAKLAKVKELAPELRQDAKRQIAYYGPYTLRANAGKSSGGHSDGHAKGGLGGLGSLGGLGDMFEDANGQNMMLTMTDGFPKNATVLTGKVGLAFLDETEADVSKGVYIHHVITQDSTKKVKPFITFCDSKTGGGAGLADSLMGGLGAGFVGTGDDNSNLPTFYTTADGKYNAGFHLGPRDSFFANAMLVNYNKEPKQVYVTYDLEYLPGIVGVDTQTSLLTVTGCMARQIKLSKTEATNTTSNRFSFLQDGNILSAKGHLHDGGEAMHLYVNDKWICSSRATYGEPIAGGETATIIGMTQCKGPIPVKKGDYLTMTSEYNLPKHPLRQSTSGTEAGVMGMARILFAAT